jgi:glutamyl-tRNA synthetase
MSGREPAVRFRVETGAVPFDDGFCGPQPGRIAGDFVINKRGGEPAYQLAVVVDDADCGVTEVLRGKDLLPSTPRQLLLYDALGLQAPAFVHVPLVVGPDGRRLAKRHGDSRLSALRAAGLSAESLVGLLAWSCGWIDRIAPVSARELLPQFRLDTIPPHPFVLTPDLLGAIGYSL